MRENEPIFAAQEPSHEKHAQNVANPVGGDGARVECETNCHRNGRKKKGKGKSP
jgi:hypothetical protein